MRCGLLGRITARPGFVAHEAPGPAVAALEPWLQAGVSASRLSLGADWRAAFLAAPLWRFWLGGGLCGAPILGAMAPSIDSGGRYFPLIALAASAGDLAILPPEFSSQDAWLRAAEALLLATLVPGAAFEAAARALESLPPPDCAPGLAARPPLRAAIGGAFAPLDDRPPTEVFAWLRRADWGRTYARRSFWWTAGGANFRPQALACEGLPDPSLFAFLLRGEFPGGAGAAMG